MILIMIVYTFKKWSFKNWHIPLSKSETRGGRGDGIPLDLEIIAKVSCTSVWDKIATGWRRSKFGVIGSLVFIAYFRSEANGSCLYGDVEANMAILDNDKVPLNMTSLRVVMAIVKHRICNRLPLMFLTYSFH